MAKNKIMFEDMEKPVKDIMKGAELKANTKVNRGGRKPKEIKADKTIRVYVTAEQKIALEGYCFKTGLSESTFLKQLLIEKEVF